ncbi:MAG: hypothetical protein IJW73_04795 [Candidatus Gastranaerophilales bacterium]|nr:hypothetical protein [Candidatus Gastranaerophilales bacterium]
MDKSLIVLGVAFVCLLLISLFLSLVMPVLEPDSQTYHFLRAWEFISNKSLLHFETNDVRALIMPINSEILYSYLLAFKKNLHGYGIVSFSSFLLVICSLWSIFEKFKYSYRKRLYAIFLLASLPAISLQLPSLQTDLLVGALLISSFALFINNSILFSSLALALAFGAKTTAIIAFIPFILLIIFYEILIEKNKKLDKFKKFAPLLFLNFFIFSSYNYFLNLAQFNHPISNTAAIIGHSFWGGIKGYIANIIHLFFQGFDFTGFKWGYYLNNHISAIQEAIFNFLNINPMVGLNVENPNVNIVIDEQTVGFGILGFLVFLPMLFISTTKIFFNKNKRTILNFLLATVFILNILFLSATTAYMVYSIRFVVSFVCLSSLILACVYKKKSFLKPIIFFFCLFYMLIIPAHNRRMPLFVVLKSLKEVNFNLDKFEDNCYRRKVISVYELSYHIFDVIKEKYSDKKNIAIIKTLESSLLYLKKLELDGYKVDFLNAGKLSQEKLDKYDLVILDGEIQDDNVFNSSEVKKNYKIIKDKIIFENNDNLNCYWDYPSKRKDLKENQATKRHCLTYPFVVKNQALKLDYSQKVHINELKKDINIYYFCKRGLKK